jgi:8-oxo-dGTP diphosphatase
MPIDLKDSRFLNPFLTVDIVIFTIEDNALKTLLIQRENNPFKDSWALPGGFLHKGETTKTAALRILKEKAGVEHVFIEQLYTFDTPGRDPRGPVMTVTYFALVPKEELILGKSGTQHPTLFEMKKLPKLAFDHADILSYSLKRLQAKLGYTNVAYSLLPRQFTFTELQKAYETILGKHLDKRNFRKKFEQLKLIEPTNKVLEGGRQRPAKLYKFKSRVPAELQRFI